EGPVLGITLTASVKRHAVRANRSIAGDVARGYPLRERWSARRASDVTRMTWGREGADPPHLHGTRPSASAAGALHRRKRLIESPPERAESSLSPVLRGRGPRGGHGTREGRGGRGLDGGRAGRREWPPHPPEHGGARPVPLPVAALEVRQQDA